LTRMRSRSRTTRRRAGEALLGRAAGDESLFARKRREAQAKAKLGELKDARKVATLDRQPVLAEPGAVQLPRFVFTWLVGDEALSGAWSLMDLGLGGALGRVREPGCKPVH
jgi:hypothetical protein